MEEGTGEAGLWLWRQGRCGGPSRGAGPCGSAPVEALLSPRPPRGRGAGLARPISGWDLLLLRVELAIQDSSVWVGAGQMGLVVLPPPPSTGRGKAS